MKFIVLLACAIALLATLAQADSLQDQIDSALKKFCGGIAITGPKKAQTFTNPKKIQVTVSKYQYPILIATIAKNILRT